MRLAVASLVVAGTALVAAQTAGPTFEVASVKTNHSGAVNTTFGMPGGGRFAATNAQLREIIRVGYGVPDFQIIDAPEWTRNERFDITAKGDGDPSRDQIFLMVRALLGDRFKLAIRQETRELPVYALVRARADGPLGPRLRTSTTDCAALRAAAQRGQPPPKSNRILCGGGLMRPGVIAIGGMTMDQIASGLWLEVGRSVINRTGLDGTFDLDLEYAPDVADATSDAPSIFTAIQEQLGLKLESTRGPVQVLVVDHIERPSEN